MNKILGALRKMDGAQETAERAAAERLLNSYFRETGKSPLGFPGPDYPALPLEMVASSGDVMWIKLPEGGILGTVLRLSESGLHRYGRLLWIMENNAWQEATVQDLSELIIGQLSGHTSQEVALQTEVDSSVAKTAHFLRADKQRSDSESRVLFGHPFHPTPKSSEGWERQDMEQFAPEMAATFQLEHLAVSPTLLSEAALPGHELPLPGRLPCHPWQARYLSTQPWMQELVRQGHVRFLGPQGPKVQPTSSVRTVRLGSWYLKLPLNIRVTHFFRLNPNEHLQRSLDVGRTIQAASAPSTEAGSTILLESGWRTLRLPDNQAQHLGVLFRATPKGQAHVLAALLESDPDGTAAPLREILARTGSAEKWLQAYLGLALPGALGWWFERGVSLEAHVQNTLVSLKQGWPSHVYFRDLEGGSLWREHPRSAWKAAGLEEQGPAIYSERAAWKRLLYYFFVNHLGHLVANLAAAACDPLDPKLARANLRQEQLLWGEVRKGLREYPLEALPVEVRDLARGYLDELLSRATLPAKANLLSRFQELGDEALYVEIPNPIKGTDKA